MIGRREFGLAGFSAAALAAVGQPAHARDSHEHGSSSPHRGYRDEWRKCAKACSDCQRECSRCAMHCANMIIEGHEGHEKTLQSCLDCADFCAAAANIVARGGPFGTLICEPCAQACRRCGDECREFSDDSFMRDCAEECFACEDACRSMTRQARRFGGRESRR